MNAKRLYWDAVKAELTKRGLDHTKISRQTLQEVCSLCYTNKVSAEGCANAIQNEAHPKTIQSGQQDLEVTVVKTEWKDTPWGEKLRVMLKDDNGNRYYGTFPRGLNDEAGSRARVRFTVESKDIKDPQFAYFKYPKHLEALEAPKASGRMEQPGEFYGAVNGTPEVKTENATIGREHNTDNANWWNPASEPLTETNLVMPQSKPQVTVLAGMTEEARLLWL